MNDGPEIGSKATILSVTQVLKELADAISKAMGAASELSTAVPGLTLYRNTAPTAPNPCTYEPSLLAHSARKEAR